MRVLISGSSGLIGSHLSHALRSEGNEVVCLVRSKSQAGPGAVCWKPSEESIDESPLEGFDAVVHLAGENIASGRWTEDKKRRIRESRVKGTRLLSQALSRREEPPKALVCASASGFYGSRGDSVLTEQSPPGDSFLADVCREWEAAADPARDRGIRVIHARFGMVLSTRGGALALMLIPFKLGIAGKISTGEQYMPWITLDDAVRVLQFCLDAEHFEGPVNATAPHPVTNAEFTKTLGRVLSRPTLATLPAFAARFVFGEMAEELLLASVRAEPRRLLDAGFTFHHAQLEPALRYLLDTKK